jgi:hypothetical protein
MGFIGHAPIVERTTADGATSQARIAAQVDSTAQTELGTVAFFKDDSGRVSVLRYVQAWASVPLGAVLMHQAGGATTVNSAGVSTLGGRDPAFVDVATLGLAVAPNLCAGIAAAAVSNTGYYFWSYIAGYCPDAAMPTSYASGQPMRISATYTGRLSSSQINASFACVGATIPIYAVAHSLMVNSAATANSTGSIMLHGWFM